MNSQTIHKTIDLLPAKYKNNWKTWNILLRKIEMIGTNGDLASTFVFTETKQPKVKYPNGMYNSVIDITSRDF